ncbi:gamma-glutamylcyclotransferase [Paramagnetospirillum marisnigri]|nr:gamma-glutamylcyclotransferase [Paramagnetospirillum marisnigri]
MTPARDDLPSTSTPAGDIGQAAPPFWVFAYGSLMWRPDFPHVEESGARLKGYHRAMCILSNHYRGTHERPGLVLGLDRGGSCRGRAFRVAADLVDEVQRMLFEREMITGVYLPRFVPITLDDGRRQAAWAFIARRDHAQYVPPDQARAVALIRQGEGKAGRSRDYLAQTVAALEGLGVEDRALKRLLALVDQGDG